MIKSYKLIASCLFVLAHLSLFIGNGMAQTGCTGIVTLTVSPTSISIGSTGGNNNSFNVSTSPFCAWHAVTNSSFLHIISGTGQGNGLVTFSVDVNVNLGMNVGSISVFLNTGLQTGNDAVTITQAAATGDFSVSVSPPSANVPEPSSTQFAVSIGRSFNGGVSLSGSGLQGTGASASFSPNPAFGTSSTMTVTVPANAIPGTYSVVVQGVNGAVAHTAPAINFTIRGRAWHQVDVTAAAAGPNAAAGNILKTQVDGIAVETYYIGPDQHVRELAWTSAVGWISTDPTGLTGSINAASGSGLNTLVDTFNNAVEAYYIGSDQHVHELVFLSGSGWSNTQDVTASTPGAVNAAIGSPVSTKLDTLNNAVEVYYIGTDQHVHELAFVTGVGWSTQDPTVLSGSINAAVGSPLATLVDTQNQALEVYYIGTDQHVHEMPFVSGQGWVGTADLTGLTGAVNPAVGSTLTVHLDTITNAVEVYYIGTEQHVHEMAFVTGQGWVITQDPTAVSGAISAAVGSALSSFIDPVSSAVEVYYIGSDQHVHELDWTAANGWGTQDATSLAGASNVAGTNLTGMFDTVNNQPEIYYIGTDLHVHQLLWNSL
jgi:hypothetical protein